MNPSGCFLRVLAWVTGVCLAVAGAGCSNIFVSKHKVLVDAISAPGVSKPSGKSYRLLAKQSVVNQATVQMPLVKACVDAALTGQGMFEPPPNVAPDFFIEVGYGTDTGGRLDPSLRETYLQLSARENTPRTVEWRSGPEVWDVRVAVLGIAGRAETAMPLLCAVAANYIATDTKVETKIEIPQNSPMIASVRENAIKALEEQGGRAQPSGASQPPPAQTSAPPPQPSTSTPGGAVHGATAHMRPSTATNAN